MGIYIRNIKMPKGCNTCPFSVFGYCRISSKRVDKTALENNTVSEWCELIDISSHGDLIDRDVLLSKINNFPYGYRGIVESKIMNTPIVINKKDSKTWKCESCVHYPPSSCDGKPCTQCDPDNVYFNCYLRKENTKDNELYY